MNLKIREIFNLINIEVQDQIKNLEFPSHVVTDSREVKKGSVFIALKGEKTDGHNFIPQAIENGASLIIAKKGKNLAKEIFDLVPVIELDDPERDLARIASERLNKNNNLKEIIAITGSVGKTTTKAAFKKVLKSKFKVHALEGNFNTLIGCTSTILGMPIETEILILEFATNKPGEIKELTEYFPPTISILTAIAPAHLEGLKSIEGVLNEKLEITRSKRIKKIFFNNDSEYLRILNHVSVGLNENSDFRISFEDSKYELPALSFRLENRNNNEAANFKVNVWGKHISMPLSLASSVGNFLGISLSECSEILRDFEAIPGRGRIIYLKNKAFLIDDAYNANPMSMRASLETFSEINLNGNKLAILGDMREMGENAVSYHYEFKDLLEKFEFSILIGNTWSEAFKDIKEKKFIFSDNWQEGLESAKKILNENNISGILVKGSNSLGLSNIVKYFEEN